MVLRQYSSEFLTAQSALIDYYQDRLFFYFPLKSAYSAWMEAKLQEPTLLAKLMKTGCTPISDQFSKGHHFSNRKMIQLKSSSAGYLLCIVSLASDRFEHIHSINLNVPCPNTSSVTCDFERFFVCMKLSHMIPRSVTWASYAPSLSN